MAQANRPFSTATQNFFNAFNAVSGRRLQERQLEIQQAIADRRISVQEGTLLLNQDKFEAEQTTQQGIQDVLTQQLSGGQQDQAGAPQVTPGELSLTPGGSIGVQAQPRLQPFTQSVQDKQRDISLKLLGLGKQGRDALSSISGIFKSENEQEALQAKQDVEDTQIFALKLDRAKTREARNKLIEDEQSQQILDTGQIDQELLRMRNMTDDELQGEIISDLAIGENLKEFVDNRLATPEPAKAPTTRERKVGSEIVTEQFDPATNTFKELSRAPRFQKREPLVSISTGEKEGEKLGARSDATVRDEIRGNARTASRQLGKVRSLSKLLESTGTGALTQFFPQIGRLIPGFSATDEQAAAAQINAFVLEQMEAFKGSTSNRELDFAASTVASLGNTPEANRIILRNFENVIFLSQQENRQFNDFVKGKGKPRDFIFNFQEVVFPNHPTFGNVTLDDIQTTAFENGITMERTLQEMRNR